MNRGKKEREKRERERGAKEKGKKNEGERKRTADIIEREERYTRIPTYLPIYQPRPLSRFLPVEELQIVEQRGYH